MCYGRGCAKKSGRESLTLAVQLVARGADQAFDRAVGSPGSFFFWTLLNRGGGQNRGYATFVWQECPHSRVTPMTHTHTHTHGFRRTKNSLKVRASGRDPHVGISLTPGLKNFMQGAFFCCFRQVMPRMSRDLGQDVPGSEIGECQMPL